jgi:hypothetical protein
MEISLTDIENQNEVERENNIFLFILKCVFEMLKWIFRSICTLIPVCVMIGIGLSPIILFILFAK